MSAAALALSAGTIAHAQQARPGSGAATEAQIAASPAAKRLKELLEVVNSGDAAVMQAYVQANGVEPTKAPPGPPGALPLVGSVLDLHRRSHGLDLLRVTKADDSGAVAVVRNRLTGDEQSLSVKTEPQSPHRITGLGTPPSAAVAASGSRLASTALSEQARLEQIGSYLKRLGDAEVFSGVVIIAREGEPVLSQAHGYADREKKIANTVDTPFNLASINKLFTGLAIGQLVEQGRLGYEDPLSKFIPDFPDPESAKTIKIKHLLSHTSGLGDFLGPDFFNSLDRMRTVQAVLDVASTEPPKFEPGTKFAYSNLGYQLLGRVIEVASGEDYFDYMRKNVFAPAGATTASFPHYDRDAVAMASPYEIEFSGGRLQHVLPTLPPRGNPAGLGLASAPDLLKLANAFHAGRIVKPETLRLHASPKPELGSLKYGYGFGLFARQAPRPLVGHGGNAPGICTEFGALTDTPYTIVVLSNLTSNTCMTVMGKILKVLTPISA